MKQNIIVLLGGRSSEHEVSLRSGLSVTAHIDTDKFQVMPVAVAKDGRWLLTKDCGSEGLVDHVLNHKKIALAQNLSEVSLTGGELVGGELANGVKIDCVFSTLHGTYGEDGAMQGFLELAQVPFVGSGSAASAIAMDKDFTKILTESVGVSTAPWVTVFAQDKWPSYDEVKGKLGEVLFIKPARQGSSVGISKVKQHEDYKKALEFAFKYDDKIVIEQAIVGREIELAVLGNSDLTISHPGEILPDGEFYTYESKYVTDGTKLVLKADLSPELVKGLQETAGKLYKAMGLAGLSRMDFFVTQDNKIWFNEPNTLPGFTSISMYPKMMGETGIAYTELISRLIQLGIDRFEREKIFKG
ncbi:MAG: D-alanine--D-alanine ligase family protein [SAR324 cluster bacterium]|nr:D-alanine--D-alanine ligase family protein [SAR324 cluster bacterium]